MCVCNREGGEVGVTEGRKCKMCVCNSVGEDHGRVDEITHKNII